MELINGQRGASVITQQASSCALHHHSFRLPYGLCMRQLTITTTEVKGEGTSSPTWLATIISLSGRSSSSSSVKYPLYDWFCNRIQLPTSHSSTRTKLRFVSRCVYNIPIIKFLGEYSHQKMEENTRLNYVIDLPNHSIFSFFLLIQALKNGVSL